MPDHVLNLILADNRVEEHLAAAARHALGRDCLGDDDLQWWEAKTRALDALLAQAQALNMPPSIN